MEKKGTNSNVFIRGCIVGYLIRHFFPPKESPTWQWILCGVIILIAIAIHIYLNYHHKVKKK